MAHSTRTWTGARTPQAIKRVRQAARRRQVLQPRRSEVKTLIARTLTTAADGDADVTRAALLEAVSALDKAAKVGAIHKNAADRRKSRLMLKVNAALGGEVLVAAGKTTRATGKTAAAKAAKARIAAGKASKAKGEQTAAGKARAALSRSTREATAAPTVAAGAEEPAADTQAAKKRTTRAASVTPRTRTTTRKSTSGP